MKSTQILMVILTLIASSLFTVSGGHAQDGTENFCLNSETLECLPTQTVDFLGESNENNLELNAIGGTSQTFLPEMVGSYSEIIIPQVDFSKSNYVVFIPTIMNKYSPPGSTQEQTKSLTNSTAYADQEFGDIPSYNTYLADDFVIGGAGWNLQEIYIPGNLFNNGTTLANASILKFQIYSDNLGVPAGDPDNGGSIWSISVLPTDSRITLTQSAPLKYGNVKLTLTTPLFLSPGRYWLVFYPNMNVTNGQYGRYVSDSANGYDAVVMNPGGGFLPQASTWTSIRSSLAWGVTQQDLAFRLTGY